MLAGLAHFLWPLSNQQNRLLWVNHSAHPGGEGRPQADIDSPRNVATAKGQHGAGVDNDSESDFSKG